MSALLLSLLTMTSLEISKVVNIRHDNVKQSIKRLSIRGVIKLPPLQEVSRTGRGPQRVEVYQLSKRDSLIVVAQLCPEFTAKLVDRWQELEDKLAATQQSLQQKAWELEARETESKARATHGSHLLTARKREVHQFRMERAELEALIQPSLLN